MGKWNSLIPMARQSRDAVAGANGGIVSFDKVREHMLRDPFAVMKATDLEVSTRRLVDLAIRSVLRDWPAYKIEGNLEHVHNDDDLDIEVIEGIVSYREQMLREETEAVQDWRNRLSQMRLRKQLEKGVPAETPESIPAE